MIPNRRRRHGGRRTPDVILRLEIRHRLLLQASGPLAFSTLTRNALNSGVCVLASPTDGVSVLAPYPFRAWPVKPQWIGTPITWVGVPSTISGRMRLVT